MQRIRFSPFNSFSVSAAAGALLMASPAFAHIDLIDPPARAHGTAASGDTDVDVNTDQKTGPCGQVTDGRTADRITTYAPGETITIQVREETPHDSYIRVALDLDGDDDFAERRPVAPATSIATETQEEAQAAEDALQNDSEVLSVFRESNNTPGFVHEIQVTLPNETSDNATLQVIQLMFNTPQVYYYQCADLVIGEGGGSSDADAGVAGTGGTGGVGGSGGSGGSATAGTGSGGPSGGSGGTGSSAGGRGGSATAAGAGGGSSTAGTASTTPPVDNDDDSDDGGCAIETTASGTGSTSLIALLGLALGVAVRRRR